MSGENMQNLNPKRAGLIWFSFMLFYLFVLSMAGLYMSHLSNRVKNEIPHIKAKQIEKMIKERNMKKKLNVDTKYQESLYSHSGGINPGFKKIVSTVNPNPDAPKQRAYEKQLAAYEAEVAEKRRIRLEEQRLREEEDAREHALIEREKQERLQRERELQQLQANQPIQVSGGISPSKTFTAPKTQTPKKAPKQQTVIGTLRTSKLGESSFQQ